MSQHNSSELRDDPLWVAVWEYVRQGRTPIPIPYGTKAPKLSEWQLLRYETMNVEALFPLPRMNVGWLMGSPSGGVLDADLDCKETIVAASYLAIPTSCTWGRASVRRPSHYGYVVTNPPDKATEVWKDPIRKNKLLELRSTGGQTVVPPSFLPGDGNGKPDEFCVWYCRGEPATVELGELLRVVKRIAAAALIGRYWPSKAHDAAMALAGGLLRAGMPVEDAEKFIAAVCCIANDGDPKNRIETVRYTKKKLDANENVTGWPTLADLLTDGGEKITRQVCDWVGARVGGPIGSKPIRADDIDSTEASLPNPDGVPDKPNLIGQTGARSTESNKAGWQWDLISSKEFISAEFKTRWLVKRLFVADEPAIIAGPMKTLKTTVAIDLAVSLGTATPFLGKFDVYNRTRVAVISGESGKPALQDTFRRVCDKRLVAPESADIQWGFRLPSFANVLDMRTLGECAAANDVKFVIADPAYLCTLAGIDPNDSKNIFAMGAHLARFAEAVLAAGATPCIVHHSNRQIVQGRPMELSDLAYSGFAEFSAQWYLLNRMSAFKGDGRHELIANAGGRQGQGGQWVLSIDEGQLNDDFTGRRWEVEVTPASEHRQEQQDDKKAQKKAEKDAAAEGADDELWRRLRMQPDHTQTKSYMRGVLKWSGDDINMSIARLMDQGRLIATKMKKPTGKGTRPIDAIRAIEPGDDLNPDNPEVQVKSPDSPSSGQEDG